MIAPRRPGRPAASSREAVEAIAIELFAENGFDKTTVPDIAAACGVSRTTFFRYYRNKSDILWAPFDAHLVRLEGTLASRPESEPLMDAVLQGIVEAFSAEIDDLGVWIRRFRLQEEPDQRAAEAMYWQRWSAVVSDYVRTRTRAPLDDFTPEAIGGAVQASLLGFLRSRDTRDAHDVAAVLADFEPQLQRIVSGVSPLLRGLITTEQNSSTH